MTNTKFVSGSFRAAEPKSKAAQATRPGHHQRHAVLAVGLEAHRREQAVADLSFEAGDGDANDKAF
jgi:hypothetical protein